ncbi:hypothetical protein AC578_8848 [Pseudocercospora eumusae]|uniref:Uncharacterized protein n=1 Tax=Pseudocercospora eumusae TaxID=321146 RepID=A0A139H5R3_9PEZI|nr:hypothetical protein AC578_8848 [Pseudocercospora eumusae]
MAVDECGSKDHLQANARQKHMDRILLHHPSWGAHFLFGEVFLLTRADIISRALGDLQSRPFHRSQQVLREEFYIYHVGGTGSEAISSQECNGESPEV